MVRILIGALSMSCRVSGDDTLTILFLFSFRILVSSYVQGTGSHLVMMKMLKRYGHTLCKAQLCKMSFSYDEDEGETSSLWCKSLNFVMTSSTFHNTSNKYEETHKHTNFKCSHKNTYWHLLIVFKCSHAIMHC